MNNQIIQSFCSTEAFTAAFTDPLPDLVTLLDRLIYFFTKSPFFITFKDRFAKASDKLPYSEIYSAATQTISNYKLTPKLVIPNITPRETFLYKPIYILKLYEVDTECEIPETPCAIYLLDTNGVTIYEMPSIFALQNGIFQNEVMQLEGALIEWKNEVMEVEKTDMW